MNKNQKIIYDIFFITVGILIVRWLDGGVNPLSIQILLYFTVGAGIYIWRNFTNWTSLTRKRVGIVFLIILIVLGGLTIYVRNYMPHGEMIYTGYDNDEGREIYFEDYRELNIPDWAKVIKGNIDDVSFILFAMAFISFSLFAYNRDKQESDRFK